MSEDSTPRLRVRSVDELTQVVPYLLGFEPEQSLVAIVRRNDQIQVTARVDLTDLAEPEAAESMLARLTEAFPGLQGVHLVAYTDDPAAGWGMLRRCEQHLGALSLSSVLVNTDTWYNNGGSGAVDRYGTIAAQAAFHGMPRLASRSELARALASPPEAASRLAAVADAFEILPPPSDVAATITALATLLQRHLDGPGLLTDGDAAQLAVLVHHPEGRNLALLGMTDAVAAEQRADLWCQVVRQVPADASHVPLGLAGMAAWVSGNGGLATVALERLDESGAANTGLARLLDDINTHVMPPSQWAPLRDRLLLDAHPLVRAVLSAEPTPAPEWETVQPPATSRDRQPSTMTGPPMTDLARPGPAI